MLTHITKALAQLKNLGISSKESLGIINVYISKLIQEVENIAIPVSTVKDKMVEEFSCHGAALDVKPRKTKSRTSGSNTCFDGHKRIEIDDHSNINMLQNENLSDCLSQEPPILENRRKKMEWIDDGTNDDHTPDLLETDPVLLKMTPSNQPLSEDDISWYFSGSIESKAESGHQTLENNSQTILVNLSEDTSSNVQKKKSKDGIHSYKESSESPHVFPDGRNEFKAKKIMKETNMRNSSKNNYDDGKEEHDSDFEDCFDDEANRKHFLVTVETMPHTLCQEQQQHSQKRILYHNARKHFSSDADFDFNTNFDVSDESDDEFSACFTDSVCEHVNNQIKSENMNNPKSTEERIDQSNIELSHQNSKTNILSKSANPSIEKCNGMSSIAKLNDMLESVAMFKAKSNRRSNDFSPIGGAASALSKNATDNINPPPNTSSLNLANSKDALNNKLSDRPKDLKLWRPSKLSVNSRHLSEAKKNQQSVNGQDYMSKTGFLSCQNEFENLSVCGSLDRHCVNFQETLIEGEEPKNTALKDMFILNKLSKNGCKEPTIRFLLCQLQLPRDINLLVDPDLTRVVEQLLNHQMSDKEFTGFNLNLVNCLNTSRFFPYQNMTDEKCVSVSPCMILPCDSDILQKLSPFNEEKIQRALLVNGDLTPLHHHKGYKSTLENKVIISTKSDKALNSESAWTSSVLTTVQKLKIDIILVKGNVNEKLMDLLDSAGVVVFTNLPFHTLKVLAFVKNIDMVTYIADASKVHLCELEFQPLSENWIDHIDDFDRPMKHYLKIVNSMEVQTVILNNSTSISACVAEEKLWKNLNCLSNAIKDKKVLPGGGRTEAWCAESLRKESTACLETNEGIRHIVLELLSQVFQNYSSLVQRNSSVHQEKPVDNLDTGAGYKIPSPLMSQKVASFVLSDEVMTKENFHSSSLQHDMTFADDNGYTAMYRHGEINKASLSHESRKTSFNSQDSAKAKSDKNCISSPGEDNNNMYDNFSSKLACWEAAVDFAYLLSNLNSLVITGIDMASSDREYAVF